MAICLEKIEEAAKATEPEKWIVTGVGFNNEIWKDPSYPTKEDLDAVAPENPMVVAKETPDPVDGEFFRTFGQGYLICS